MFQRKKKIPSLPHSSIVATALYKWIIQLQHKWAGVLHSKTRHWNRGQQKRFFFIVCLVIGGLSTRSLISVFRKEALRNPSFSKPTPMLPPLTPPENQQNITAHDTLIFLEFRKTLDSLLQTPEGRATYETFLQQRPGFMDSLAVAEQLLKQSFPH